MTLQPLPVPCAPNHLPLLGHAVALWRQPFRFLTTLPRFGPLVRVDLGTLPVYFATTAELTHDLLVSHHQAFDKGRLFDRARALAGDGLATAPRDIHRRNRRIVQPVFHHRHLAHLTTAMTHRTQDLAGSWRPGQELDMATVMTTHAIRVLTDTMFGGGFGRQAAETTQRYVPVIFKYMLYRALMPRFLDRLPLPANRRFADASRRLKKVIDELVHTTRNAPAADSDRTPDMLALLLTARHDETGEQLSDREIRDELITFLNAGVETVAATMAWAWDEIAHRPEVQDRLVAEITSTVGNRPVVFEDLPHLGYTRQVISEALRLHAVPLLMRRAVTSVALAGVEIPPGTELAFSPYALHRDPRTYPDPEQFDPDRWARGPDAAHRITFMPFGAGPRKCVGDGYAWALAMITLVTVLSRWRVRPRDGHAPKQVISAVVRPDTVSVTVLPRT